ncbi:hypothetical protein [Neorhizobium vignae]|jgi:hypothetical protein|uniref:hypothetical protein n=1 Tax=Neorhizobium vignae TaxID=690585 RepID=UPI00055A3EFD|nr:hypothetical protein [Neorhizobium vignae]
MKVLHPVAGALALASILAFWLSTAFSEISGNMEMIRSVKLAIPWGLPLLIPALAFSGFSGFRLGGRWKHPAIVAKKKRMPVIALNGLLVLVPCALILRQLTLNGDFGATFYAVQALELCAGALNIVLLGMSFRDGLRLKRRIGA